MADSPNLWCHAGNDADFAAVAHLCEDLLDDVDGLSVVLTTSRADLRSVDLPLGIETAPKPRDIPRAAGQFLDGHRPIVAAIVGSDVPSALVQACNSRRIPMVYLDARQDRPRALGRWLAALGGGSHLKLFHSIHAISEADAANLVVRGADPDRIEVTGALEAPPENPPYDEEERDYLSKALGTRPVWLVAGLPLSEFDLVEAAFQRAGRMSHRLLLIASPHALDDGPGLAQRFESKGWRTALRSRDETPDDDTRVLVADLDGEDGLWFRLASITYLGGSLVSGHFIDPYLPGALGSALLAGETAADPTSRSAVHLAKLARDGACRRVRNASSLGEAVADLLAPDRAALLAGKAWNQIFAGMDTRDRAREVLRDLLRAAQE